MSATAKKEEAAKTGEVGMKDVAVVNQNTAVATFSQEDLQEMYESQGAGMEEITASDVNIPFLVVLQSNSPAATKAHMDYVKGAEAGMILNKSVRDAAGLFKGEEGIYWVPVKYTKQITEWIPRTKGGGFVQQHDETIMKVAIKQENGGYKLPNGNDLVLSSVWFGLLVEPSAGSVQQAIMSLTGTNVRSGKNLNSAIRGLVNIFKDPKDGQDKRFTPPAWASVFKATTLPRSNEKGSWYVWNFNRLGYTKDFFKEVADESFGKMVYSIGKEMMEQISRGVIKAQAPSEEDVQGGGEAATQDDF